MVGDLIRARRKAKGWSQTTLAERMGWPQNYLSRVEGGKVGLPQRDTLERLGQLLGVTLAEFYRAAGVLENVNEAAPEPRPSGEHDDIDALPLAEVIAHVKAKPGDQWRAQVARTEARLGPEKFGRWCRNIMRAWTSNGEAMAATLDLGDDNGA